MALWSWVRRRPRWAAAGVAVVVILAAGIPATVVSLSGSSPARTTAALGHQPSSSVTPSSTSRPASRNGHRSSTSTSALAPSVAAPSSTAPTTVPLSAAGTGGLARAVAPGQALPAVAPLQAVRSVDAIVQLPASITAAETQALTHLQGVTAVEEVDIGTVQVQGTPMVVVGVDPGTFREFTPQVTASADRLWSYVAAGALVADYATASTHGLGAGQAIRVTPVGGARPPATGWLGALASLGLPGIGLVVDSAYAGALGLVANNGLIVSAPGVDPYTLQGILTSTLHGAGVELLHAEPAAG